MATLKINFLKKTAIYFRDLFLNQKEENLKEKAKSLATRINEVKQVVESASNYSPKRLAIIFCNTEYRLKEIVGIDQKYISELNDITLDCMDILDKAGLKNSIVSAKDSFDSFNDRLSVLLNNIILDDANKVVA